MVFGGSLPCFVVKDLPITTSECTGFIVMKDLTFEAKDQDEAGPLHTDLTGLSYLELIKVGAWTS